MPLLGDPVHAEIVRSLQTRLPELLHLGTDLSPRAIVLVTAHWSERQPTISTGSSPDLFYDYYGFPQEAYELKYNAPGSPDVALEVAKAMKEEGLSPRLDDQRGWQRLFHHFQHLILPRNCRSYVRDTDVYQTHQAGTMDSSFQ